MAVQINKILTNTLNIIITIAKYTHCLLEKYLLNFPDNAPTIAAEIHAGININDIVSKFTLYTSINKNENELKAYEAYNE